MRLFFAIVLLACETATACPGLEVQDGWIREAPPGATVMAGYARLRNVGATPLILGKVRSSGFGGAELHRTVVENGVSRMLRGQTISLSPGEQVALAPGSWHLMLFRPVRPLKAGDTVSVMLECGATGLPFPFTIKNE